MKTRILAFLLSALFVLPLFAACGGNEPPTNEEPETSTEGIKLGDSNTRIYKIISPEEMPEDGMQILSEFAADLRAKSGIVLTMGTDTAGSSEKEILFGYTNRKETRAVMEKIGFYDFAIEVSGERIVVAAHTPEKLKEAGKYFTQNFIKSEKEGNITSAYFTGESYHKKNSTALLFTQDNPLSSYTVVCKKGDSDAAAAADKLIEAIKNAYGITLPKKDDSVKETALEILVGATNRAASTEALSAKLYDSEFAIRVKGKQLALAAKASANLPTAVETFCYKTFKRGFSYTFNIAAAYSEVRSIYLFEGDSAYAEGADVRVMSFNVLNENSTDPQVANLTARAENAAAMILHFAPDIVGLQEMTNGWYTKLGALIGENYSFLDKKNEKNLVAHTALAYNKEKVKMISHGTKCYSAGNNFSYRMIAWGLFETIATGERFVALSTHWDLPKNDEQYGYRMIHSNELATFVKEMEDTYSCPVITTGDYNANSSSEPYQNFINKSGYLAARDTAAVQVRKCVTYHTFGETPSLQTSNSAIDHIFSSTNVEFLLYNVVVDDLMMTTSDHFPIYADVKLN